MVRKMWDKPKLVVLLRDRPEEAVLAGCKGLYAAGDPSSDKANCSDAYPKCDIPPCESNLES